MIPDFQTVFLPYLKLLADGKNHSSREVEDALAKQFKVSEEERREMIPSGRAKRFANRVSWSGTYLRQAHLVENVSRGVYRITPQGQSLLTEKPDKLNIRSLKRFPEFQEFQGRFGSKSEEQHEESVSQTPHEVLDTTYQSLRNELATELLAKLKASSPTFFEQAVVDLLVAMGYGGSLAEAASLTRRGSDEGIDGIIKEDKLGLDTIYVQAKRWEGQVGRPVVQAFSGSLDGVRARKGVMLTTSRYSSEAREYVAKIEKKIVLIDGEELSKLMIDHNIGVAESQNYVIKKIDADYFDEE
ncbi:MAG TPA: restriction endonuclease [Candidatus Kapabacteria bacterium]|nr:restriction endonuclease [Candidatus Kapabacteria bacterium]